MGCDGRFGGSGSGIDALTDARDVNYMIFALNEGKPFKYFEVRDKFLERNEGMDPLGVRYVFVRVCDNLAELVDQNGMIGPYTPQELIEQRSDLREYIAPILEWKDALSQGAAK